MTPGESRAPAPSWRYSRTAIALHWLLAILMTCTAAIGWRMMWIRRQPGSEQWFDLHKSIGIVIAALVVVRVLWRLGHRPEPLPPGPPWHAQLAGVSHVLLYVLMIGLPITGYLGASYSKAGVAWFGIATPRWTVPDRDLAEAWFAAHAVLLWSAVAVVLVHAAGALKHLFDRDGVFQRMWFAPRR